MDAHEKTLTKLATAVGLPADFARMSPTAKLSAILELPEPKLFIRRLRADELYFLLNDIGLEDAHDLLAYASPDQRQAVIDLDVWSGDRLELARFDRIVEMLISTSYDLAVETVKRIDLETLAFYIFSRCRVALAREEVLGGETFLTPDGVFEVACDEPELVPAVRRFLDLLYAAGIEFAHLILHGGMNDTPSSLEETAFRFRDARLADLGFAVEEEKYELWEPFDVEALKVRLDQGIARSDTESGPMLALVIANANTGMFFFEAAMGLKQEWLVILMHRMTYLVNRVLSVRTKSMYEEGAWEAAARHAVSMVSIGLEALSKGDLSKATTILSLAWPIELYRTGIETIRPIHLRAKRVIMDIGGSDRLDLFPPIIANTLRAAIQFPPVMFEGLVKNGALSYREFLSRSEVHRMDEVCRDAQAVVEFGKRVLGFQPNRRDTGVTFANVFATAWARTVLSQEVSLEPLSGEDVAKLLVAAFVQGKIRPYIREQALGLAKTANQPERVRAFLEYVLDEVEETIGGLDPGSIPDLRFLGDILLVKGQ